MDDSCGTISRATELFQKKDLDPASQNILVITVQITDSVDNFEDHTAFP